MIRLPKRFVFFIIVVLCLGVASTYDTDLFTPRSAQAIDPETIAMLQHAMNDTSQMSQIDPYGVDPYGIDERTCGTAVPTPRQMEAVETRLNLLYGNGRAQPVCDDVIIPVIFHVIYDSTPFIGGGNVPLETLQAQIEVMNDAFPGYTFTLDPDNDITRTDNAVWYNGMLLGTPTEDMVKGALGRDTDTHLNFYTANISAGAALLGWATFPWEYEDNPQNDGVVVLYSSLPGGSTTNYDLGQTATHEVGHWLGLRHIWGDGDCSVDDFVSDTALAEDSTSGCPIGQMTCGSLDDINNFMDYSYDACMDSFSQGQVDRMCQMLETYRPKFQRTAPVCGNNILDAGETCDDGGTADGDGCSAICQLEGSGNVCQTYMSTDVPKPIADTPGQTVTTSTVSVPAPSDGNLIVTDVNVVGLTADHDYIGDLDIRMHSAAGTGLWLMEEQCGNQANYNLSLDDEAAATWPCPPTDGGAYLPSNPLSKFDGENAIGDWTLYISDNNNPDGGTLTSWGLEICTTADADYSDLAASFGYAYHTEPHNAFLGATVDDDAVSSLGSDDGSDDGITANSPNTWAAGENVSIDATISGSSGYLACWFDWDQNGQFNEAAVTTGELAVGTHTVPVSIPDPVPWEGAITLDTRCRLYETDPTRTPTAVDATGGVTGGEVEDHRLNVGGSPTAVEANRIATNATDTTMRSIIIVVGLLSVMMVATFAARKRRS